MIEKLLCLLFGAKLIQTPREMDTAIEKLKKAGFEIPTFQISRKTMEDEVSAQIFTAYGKSCIILNDPWFEFDEHTKIHVLIHELLHAYDHNIVDVAYRFDTRYDKLTIAEQIRNADTIAELVNGPPPYTYDARRHTGQVDLDHEFTQFWQIK